MPTSGPALNIRTQTQNFLPSSVRRNVWWMGMWNPRRNPVRRHKRNARHARIDFRFPTREVRGAEMRPHMRARAVHTWYKIRTYILHYENAGYIPDQFEARGKLKVGFWRMLMGVIARQFLCDLGIFCGITSAASRHTFTRSEKSEGKGNTPPPVLQEHLVVFTQRRAEEDAHDTGEGDGFVDQLNKESKHAPLEAVDPFLALGALSADVDDTESAKYDRQMIRGRGARKGVVEVQEEASEDADTQRWRR
ncbi:hypothetical protein C8J57DRAFT_1230009 [Mycena rebaudengoi]|nr:hypothetical protein C8J57DRAFT_1230009 [Mycena rebaudengoi]